VAGERRAARANDVILGYGPDLIVRFASPATLPVLGRPPEELADTPIARLAHPDDRPALVGHATALDPSPVSGRFLHRDGHWVRLEATADPGAATVRLVAPDVDERRRVEELLRVQREQTERALTEARERALEASRLKSRFLATMSHEIRTPMNGVLGLATLLLRTPLDATQRRYAEGIHRSGEALLAVLNDVLDLSKLEAGRVELERVAFDPGDLVAEVVALVGASGRAKDVDVVAECAPDLPRAVRGDPGRVRQVLLNLAANAVKFTERGRVVVRARGAGPAGGSGRVVVRLEVVDTGIGIDPRDQERVFDAFAQADSSTTRRYGGTGLGLAIGRELVEAMGGAIGVVSEPGRGSTFWCEIPFECVTAVVPAAPGLTGEQRARGEGGVPQAPRPAEAERARRGTVLVAEDDEINQLVAVAMLDALGYGADVAGNGRVALELAAGRAYDAVLMDCQMPEMDGYVATAELRRREAGTRRTPVIALTAGARTEDRARCLAAGMDDHLAKPLTSAELGEALGRWIRPAAG
jgi:signal transduction histidine kinase/ActR/RegA family two-component response regulator